MLDTDGYYFALLLPLFAACATSPRDAGAPTPARPVESTSSAALPALPPEARAVIEFWRAAGPGLWFAKEPEFDRRFRERFADAHAAEASGALGHWAHTADGALALILLLDQYPRNAFRGTARMYATDAAARAVAERAVAAGFDRLVAPDLQLFVILPFGHSESLVDQERSVALCRRLGPSYVERAEHHRGIVQRFGRFPHRNALLGRTSTEAERSYLENGGYQG